LFTSAVVVGNALINFDCSFSHAGHRSTNQKDAHMTAAKPGLYANIHAKQERIAKGSKEHMRKPSEPGAPSDANFKKAKKSAKPKKAAK